MSLHKWVIVLPGLLVLIVRTAPAENDPFLQAIEEEAQRVEKISTTPARKEAKPAAVAVDRDDRRAFEEMLKKHKGTFVLYQRLQPKDKAEVFKAYREGADFKTLRKKIVDRRLHQ